MSLLFIILLIIGITLYLTGKRVIASLFFFFFLFDAFQLIPEEIIGMKPTDLALLYVLILFIYGSFRYDDFIPKNSMSLCIAIYLSFIIIEIILSHFYYHISWVEIIRTVRQSFLVLAYFIFRRIDKKDINLLSQILFCIVCFQCGLFIVEVFTGLPLLTGSEANVNLGWIYRCYNTPFMLYFFAFYGIFNNPFKQMLWKHTTTIIPIITMFLPLHRSLSLVFIFTIALGLLLRYNMLNSTKNIIISSILAVTVITISSTYISQRTINDINKVTQGEFLETDDGLELDNESTLLFRMAHFYERYMKVTETRVGTLFGLGLMTENSSYTNNQFNFFIGLQDDKTGNVTQLDTSDIAWSNFIIRYGFIGTIVFISCFYVFFIISYLKKITKETIALPIVLYLVLIIGTSFTSDQLYKLSFLIFPLIYYDIQHEKA